MKIKYFPIILSFFLLVAQAEELPKKITDFENTYPTVEGSKPWGVRIDSSALKPHFITSKFVTNTNNNQVYLNFMVIKDFEVEEYGLITGVWLKVYDKSGNLIGTVDHTNSSFEKSSKLFSISKNLKRGAVFKVEVKAPYEFTKNPDIGSVKVVLTKS